MSKFNGGRTVATAGVDGWMKESEERLAGVALALTRHFDGDWGEVCREDKQANNDALKVGNEGRVMSAYTIDGEKVWIITEWDRSVTTVLFPSEY